MHTIHDLEALLKEVEATIHHWFGTGVTGEQGKDAVHAVIAAHAKHHGTESEPASAPLAPAPTVIEPVAAPAEAAQAIPVEAPAAEVLAPVAEAEPVVAEVAPAEAAHVETEAPTAPMADAQAAETPATGA